MRKWRDTPDWWMSTAATRSLTGRSPARKASRMRSRVGSARGEKALICMSVHMYICAYYGDQAKCRGESAAPRGALAGGLGARRRGGRAEPSARGGARQIGERAELEVLACLAAALEPPLGIGERAGRTREDEVHVRLVRAERAHHLGAQRVERHSPLDGAGRLGRGALDLGAQRLEDRAQLGRLAREEAVDGRAEIGARAP